MTLHENDLQIAHRVIRRFLCCLSNYLFAQINNVQIFQFAKIETLTSYPIFFVCTARVNQVKHTASH